MDEEEAAVMLRRFLIIFAAFGTLFIAAAAAKPAQAASSSPITYHGITVAPAIMNLSLLKNQATADFKITVTNNTKQAVTLDISTLDFKSLNETGGVAFIGSRSLGHKYGLANWLDTPQQLELMPKQAKAVPITVENRDDLSPGGHYAAVVFQASAKAGSRGNKVNINQAVSSLIFVRKISGEHYGISLTKADLPVSWFHLPTNIDLFFRNTGNVQAVPRGLLTITSPLSHEVSRGIINTDSGLVLPESSRLVRVPLFSTGPAWLPGWYRVKITFHPEGVPTTSSYEGRLFYVNLISLVILAAIILVLRRYGRRGIVIAKRIGRPAKRLISRRLKTRKAPPPAPAKGKKIVVKHDEKD